MTYLNLPHPTIDCANPTKRRTLHGLIHHSATMSDKNSSNCTNYLNRNTVNVSYSCMPNIRQIITPHNKSVLQTNTPDQLKQCNWKKNPCPLNGSCFTTAVVYQAIITRNDNQKEETYIGLTEGTFKSIYIVPVIICVILGTSKHKLNSTTLSQSQYIWTKITKLNTQ